MCSGWHRAAAAAGTCTTTVRELRWLTRAKAAVVAEAAASAADGVAAAAAAAADGVAAAEAAAAWVWSAMVCGILVAVLGLLAALFGMFWCLGT